MPTVSLLVPLAVGVLVGLVGRFAVPPFSRLPPAHALVASLVGAYAGWYVAGLFGGSGDGVVDIVVQVVAAGAVQVLGSMFRGMRKARSQHISRHGFGDDILADLRARHLLPPDFPTTDREQPTAPHRVPPPAQRQPRPSAPPPPPAPSQIFLCYRRNDTQHAAGRLASDLRNRFGRTNIFIDVESIGTGQNYRIGVGEAIQKSAVVLVLIGKGWAAERDEHGLRLDDPNDNVRQEVEFALQLGRALPVLIDGAPMPNAKRLPPSLAPLTELNAAPLRHDTWEIDTGRLVKAIESRQPS